MYKALVNTPFLRWACALMLALLVTRLLSLGLYPLYDTTEARYGEMARIMFETQNWVTPQFDYNVPFWGKPPFQTWISAISFSWLGISEFSARLPHFLCSLLVLVLIYRLTKKLTNQLDAIYSCFILTSTLGFIIASGMVMTDAALLMATTLAMISFWFCYQDYCQGQRNIFYGHMFFIAIALGLLIKGPVATALIMIALISWGVWNRCLWQALKSLPWLTGIPLMLALTAPWYIWAEIRSPGFLEYFIIGEHIERFLVSGWQGDLYGSAHVEPRGMIWVFWLACASPWSFVIGAMLIKKWRKAPSRTIEASQYGINKYLICWMISPLILFTFAGNILPAYVLPGLSAMAVLIAINTKLSKASIINGVVSLQILILTLGVFIFDLTSKSAESALLNNQDLMAKSAKLFYWKKRPFSAQFYSKGQAQLLDSNLELNQLMNKQNAFFLGITHNDYQELKVDLVENCVEINQTNQRLLLKCY